MFGTCAGMETLAIVAAAGCQADVKDGNIPPTACSEAGPITRGFNSSDVSLPLAMVYPPGTSKLYHDAGAQILSWLEDESIAFNYHSGGATPSTFTRVCHPEHE